MREHGQNRWPELAKGIFCITENFNQYINSPKNLPRQEPSSYNGENNHWMAGNITCAPCHHLEHYTGPWKENFGEIRHPRNHWLRQWYPFLKQSHRHLALRGCMTSHTMPQPLGRWNDAKGCWRLRWEQWVVGPSSIRDTHLPKATWLASTRASANQEVPTLSKLLCSVEEDGVSVVPIKNILGLNHKSGVVLLFSRWILCCLSVVLRLFVPWWQTYFALIPCNWQIFVTRWSPIVSRWIQLLNGLELLCMLMKSQR